MQNGDLVPEEEVPYGAHAGVKPHLLVEAQDLVLRYTQGRSIVPISWISVRDNGVQVVITAG